MPREHIEEIWAESGGKSDPGPTKIAEGWLSELPNFQEQNWEQNRGDEILQWIEQHGIQDWSALTTYADTGLCLATNGVIYQSQQAANLNHAPIGDGGTWWEQVNFEALLVASEGYLILAGDVPFIIQWGTTNVAAATTVNHTLPMTYPTVHAMAYGQDDVTTIGAELDAGGWAISLTQIELMNAAGSAKDIGWISLGW